MKNNEKNQHAFVGVLITHLIYGVLSTLLVLLFMLLFSILITKETLPAETLSYVGIIGVFLASLLPCFFLVRMQGKALLTSLIQGVFNFVLYYIMGLVIFMRIVPGNINWYYFIACMVGAVAGGVLSAVFTPQRRRIKNK